MSQLTIKVNGQTVHGNRREPLLVQLEKAGLQPEFQCRNGMCGACRCKLKVGAVNQGDTMAFIAPNEVLACCSIPQTNIDIEFDYLLAQTQQASKKAANS